MSSLGLDFLSEIHKHGSAGIVPVTYKWAGSSCGPVGLENSGTRRVKKVSLQQDFPEPWKCPVCTMTPQRRDSRMQSFPSFYNRKWHGARGLPDCPEHAQRCRQNVLCSPPSSQSTVSPWCARLALPQRMRLRRKDSFPQIALIPQDAFLRASRHLNMAKANCFELLARADMEGTILSYEWQRWLSVTTTRTSQGCDNEVSTNWMAKNRNVLSPNLENGKSNITVSFWRAVRVLFHAIPLASGGCWPSLAFLGL